MKGMILAGGLATRLRPLTSVTNKHFGHQQAAPPGIQQANDLLSNRGDGQSGNKRSSFNEFP